MIPLRESFKCIRAEDWELRAYLSGKKTQIRSIIKPIPAEDIHLRNAYEGDLAYVSSRFRKSYTLYGKDKNRTVHQNYYGNPGKKILIKEHFVVLDQKLNTTTVRYPIDGSVQTHEEWGHNPCRQNYNSIPKPQWFSCITMPDYLSRICLGVENYRAERIRDISDDDILREGIEETEFYKLYKEDPIKYPLKNIFSRYWQNRHGGLSWSKNNWVWVTNVRRII